MVCNLFWYNFIFLYVLNHYHWGVIFLFLQVSEAASTEADPRMSWLQELGDGVTWCLTFLFEVSHYFEQQILSGISKAGRCFFIFFLVCGLLLVVDVGVAFPRCSDRWQWIIPSLSCGMLGELSNVWEFIWATHLVEYWIGWSINSHQKWDDEPLVDSINLFDTFNYTLKVGRLTKQICVCVCAKTGNQIRSFLGGLKRFLESLPN